MEGDHGQAFRRILAAFGVPQERVVLQLPLSGEQQRWGLKFVADNYSRNGFRLVVNATDAQQAFNLLDQIQPEAIKLDGRELTDEDAALKLLLAAHERGVKIIFKRVESARVLAILRRLETFAAQEVWLQGFVYDFPQSSLAGALEVLAQAA